LKPSPQRPSRIQRKRAKGWKMPPNTVYVGRPTKWGNAFRLGDQLGYDHQRATTSQRVIISVASPRYLMTNQDLVDAYRRTLASDIEQQAPIELKGKNLACWCPLGQPCHADILLELANR
jgi:Domain of unknown function (DUF4326)